MSVYFFCICIRLPVHICVCPCLPLPSRVILDDTFCDPCQASSPPDTRACARPALGQTPFSSSSLQ
ncbi:MAG: hypothetical protein FE78DRAFT_475229 [Acidomyces sp. 'richmondensis']|nr:MAG: hypothetical protein FE78DRAFT_475229 [Acidomyces sp. 'richmondensis']